jgi:hypothetical protein
MATKRKKKRYTVVLLYPDYMTDSYGTDIFTGWTKAENVEAAAKNVQKQASRSNDKSAPPEDFAVLLVYLGHLMAQADATNFETGGA